MFTEYGSTVTFSSCTITDNTASSVRAHARNLPSTPWETHVLLVFTGRRCLCLLQHRHNDVLLDHRQHSFWIGACSCSKFPIALMGDSHFARYLQGGGVFVQEGTVFEGGPEGGPEYTSYEGTLSIVDSQVYSNQATFVRAHAQNPQCLHVVKRFSCQPSTEVTTVTSRSVRRGPTSLSMAAAEPPSALGQRPSSAFLAQSQLARRRPRRPRCRPTRPWTLAVSQEVLAAVSFSWPASAGWRGSCAE